MDLVDVHAAFLHSLLEGVLLAPATPWAGEPPGAHEILFRAVYGCRCAHRRWRDRLANCLAQNVFTCLRIDGSVLGDRSTGSKVPCHVDDLVFAGRRAGDQCTRCQWLMHDLAELLSTVSHVTVLGCKVTRTELAIVLEVVQKYSADCLRCLDTGPMGACNTAAAPWAGPAGRDGKELGEALSQSCHAVHRRAGGILLYIIMDRPDLHYSAKERASALNAPRPR